LLTRQQKIKATLLARQAHDRGEVYTHEHSEDCGCDLLDDASIYGTLEDFRRAILKSSSDKD
jgi:hypothetical protein